MQSLETLGKTSDCLASVRGVPEIKTELVQGKPNWQSWNFTELTNALCTWTKIHPLESVRSREAPRTTVRLAREAFTCKSTTLSHIRQVGVCIAITLHTSPVNAQSSRALLSKGISYKERGYVLTAPAHIESHIAEAVGTETRHNFVINTTIEEVGAVDVTGGWRIIVI